MTATLSVKDEVFRLAERLPADATWDDVLYEISLTQAVEAGVKAADEGRTVSTNELRRFLGIPA